MAPKFKIVKKGYDPTEVNDYIDDLESVVKAYKDKESVIKNAIIKAQEAADNIIKNAKNESIEVRRNSANQIDTIIASVSMQRDMVRTFHKEYSALAEKYLTKISEEDVRKVTDKIDGLEKYLLQFSSDQFDEPKKVPEAKAPENKAPEQPKAAEEPKKEF